MELFIKLTNEEKQVIGQALECYSRYLTDQIDTRLTMGKPNSIDQILVKALTVTNKLHDELTK